MEFTCHCTTGAGHQKLSGGSSVQNVHQWDMALNTIMQWATGTAGHHQAADTWAALPVPQSTIWQRIPLVISRHLYQALASLLGTTIQSAVGPLGTTKQWRVSTRGHHWAMGTTRHQEAPGIPTGHHRATSNSGRQ